MYFSGMTIIKYSAVEAERTNILNDCTHTQWHKHCKPYTTCFGNTQGWILRQWAPGHKHVKAPTPPPLHRGKTPRLKETQNMKDTHKDM